MLAAELAYAVTACLRRRGRTNNRDEKRDTRNTSHDVSVAGFNIRPGTDLHTAAGSSNQDDAPYYKEFTH